MSLFSNNPLHLPLKTGNEIMLRNRKPIDYCNFLLVAVILNISSVANAQAPTDSMVLRIIRDRVESGRSAGIILALVDATGREKVYSWGNNVAGGQPIDVSTVFEIGSITKVFTGLLLADMAQRGEVRLDDPVSKYLPLSVRVPQKAGKQITLLDIAAQRSGLPGRPANLQPADPENPFADYTLAAMYEALDSIVLEREIGSAYEYSNFAVAVLGQALAARVGKTYEDLVAERILKPLRMNDTGTCRRSGMRVNLAQGHDVSGNPVPNYEFGVFAPAGALCSNMKDMLKFLNANIRPPATSLGAAIGTSHVQQFEINSYAGVGFNWHYLRQNGDTVIWHPGETGGYHSFIGFNPITKMGAVLLSNSRTAIEDISFHFLMKDFPLEETPAYLAKHTEVLLDSATLSRYVGTYEFAPGERIVIELQRGKLFGSYQFRRMQLHADAMGAFFLLESDTTITFETGPDGKVTALVQREDNNETKAMRIAP
jgi:serine-type D-Ala-D-Ala carboxypeptidase/endopeptidase